MAVVAADRRTRCALREIGRVGAVRCFVSADVAGAFTFASNGDGLVVTPRDRAPAPRTLASLGCFEVQHQQGVYPQISLYTGNILFDSHGTDAQRLVPASFDPQRTLRALYVGPQVRHEDDPEPHHRVMAHIAESLSQDHPEAFRHAPTGHEFERRCERFQGIHFGPRGWCNAIEMHLLDWMVRDAARPGLHAVEIGTYQGRSTCVIASAMGDEGIDGLVFSIDPNLGHAAQVDVAAAHLRSFGQRDRLVQIQRRTRDVTGVLRDGIASFCFIDGSHSYDDVCTDFEFCDRLLMPGGILAFHDVFALSHLGPNRTEPPYPDPARVIDEIVLPTGRYTPIMQGHLTLALRKTAT